MQLLSHDADRLVFHVDQREVDLLQHLVEFGMTARRGPIRFSQQPAALPTGAPEEFAVAAKRSQAAGRDFLRRVFRPQGGYLEDSASGGRGYGLTLSRPDIEKLLQALNDLKLAHWEHLGCPGEGEGAEEAPRKALPSLMVMDLVNQIQMLLLNALSTED